MWLLSKDRKEDAEKSLQWLRGWTTKEGVAKEFAQLQRYSERSKSCNLCVKQDQVCLHQEKMTTKGKFAELTRKRTLKPFFIVIFLFFLAQFTGFSAMRPYMVQVLKAYRTPIEADQATVILLQQICVGFVSRFFEFSYQFGRWSIADDRNVLTLLKLNHQTLVQRTEIEAPRNV